MSQLRLLFLWLLRFYVVEKLAAGLLHIIGAGLHKLGGWLTRKRT